MHSLLSAALVGDSSESSRHGDEPVNGCGLVEVLVAAATASLPPSETNGAMGSYISVSGNGSLPLVNEMSPPARIGASIYHVPLLAAAEDMPQYCS